MATPCHSASPSDRGLVRRGYLDCNSPCSQQIMRRQPKLQWLPKCKSTTLPDRTPRRPHRPPMKTPLGAPPGRLICHLPQCRPARRSWLRTAALGHLLQQPLHMAWESFGLQVRAHWKKVRFRARSLRIPTTITSTLLPSMPVDPWPQSQRPRHLPQRPVPQRPSAPLAPPPWLLQLRTRSCQQQQQQLAPPPWWQRAARRASRAPRR
mmetsp:Transcript_53317/g.116771  ORF Transcript_53317/g.116771 Transcript_53317/m.116771 type:complete len:208 (+) Transcript_53317:59-682(+)